MNLKRFMLGGLAACLLAAPVAVQEAKAQDSLFFPNFTYRTGPYAPNGIPFANGFRDYFMLLNERDGGIEGARIEYEECETGYNTQRGVECYERLKDRNPLAVAPLSTGITYQLVPRAPQDEIPIHSMGYGRTDAADGTVFPWIFNFPMTYWSQASGFIRYLGQQEGGLENLEGKKLVLIYHNSAYGREPIPTLERLAEEHNYELTTLAVDHPGQEQRSTWLQVRRIQPDYIFLWGWGVMNQVAIREAASIGFPMDQMIGVWWSGAEQDVEPAGEGAIGYKAGTFHAPGEDYPVHQQVLEHVYNGDEEEARENNWGQVLYNRGLFQAFIFSEAARAAINDKGGTDIDGGDMRAALETLDISEALLERAGFSGFVQPFQVTCENHEGIGGKVAIQQWTGEEWEVISEWLDPMRDVVRPMIEESAAAYAEEQDIEPRSCE